jgi:tetratricopeptide (TPR) repeat protein
VTAPETGTIVEQKKEVVPPETTSLPKVPEAAPPQPEPAPVSEPNADALYATAMSELLGGDAQQARKTLHRVLRQDPHYAKAHFRMGEIALLNRNLNPAMDELNLALADSDRLDSREQQLARLGLALASRNRFESQRIADEISQRWPEDPDLSRMRETFPGMFMLPRERGRRRLRP